MPARDSGQGERGNNVSDSMERAQQQAQETQEIRARAETTVGLVQRLREGWRRVHEKDVLGDLFEEEFGKVKK